MTIVSRSLRYMGLRTSLLHRRNLPPDLSFSSVMERFPDEGERYDYFLWSYYTCLPVELRRHRRYFARKGRGFGESAFHAMWWSLIAEFTPQRLVEIGVYRGQTLSLWTLIATLTRRRMDAWGVTPLTPSGDSVSDYVSLDYAADIARNFDRFGLGSPHLFQGLSQDPSVRHFLSSQAWDVIYIDGSHDEDVVRADVALARACMPAGAILVMDDASLYSGYRPRASAFAGHPGPSSVANSPTDMAGFTQIGSCGHNRVFQRSA